MYTICVIIPVYNAEKYLKKAIDSVLSQTLARIELVLIPSCDRAMIAIITIKTVLMIVLKKFKTISSWDDFSMNFVNNLSKILYTIYPITIMIRA